LKEQLALSNEENQALQSDLDELREMHSTLKSTVERLNEQLTRSQLDKQAFQKKLNEVMTSNTMSTGHSSENVDVSKKTSLQVPHAKSALQQNVDEPNSSASRQSVSSSKSVTFTLETFKHDKSTIGLTKEHLSPSKNGEGSLRNTLHERTDSEQDLKLQLAQAQQDKQTLEMELEHLKKTDSFHALKSAVERMKQQLASSQQEKHGLREEVKQLKEAATLTSLSPTVQLSHSPHSSDRTTVGWFTEQLARSQKENLMLLAKMKETEEFKGSEHDMIGKSTIERLKHQLACAEQDKLKLQTELEAFKEPGQGVQDKLTAGEMKQQLSRMQKDNKKLQQRLDALLQQSPQQHAAQQNSLAWRASELDQKEQQLKAKENAFTAKTMQSGLERSDQTPAVQIAQKSAVGQLKELLTEALREKQAVEDQLSDTTRTRDAEIMSAQSVVSHLKQQLEQAENGKRALEDRLSMLADLSEVKNKLKEWGEEEPAASFSQRERRDSKWDVVKGHVLPATGDDSLRLHLAAQAAELDRKERLLQKHERKLSSSHELMTKSQELKYEEEVDVSVAVTTAVDIAVARWKYEVSRVEQEKQSLQKQIDEMKELNFEKQSDVDLAMKISFDRLKQQLAQSREERSALQKRLDEVDSAEKSRLCDQKAAVRSAVDSSVGHLKLDLIRAHEDATSLKEQLEAKQLEVDAIRQQMLLRERELKTELREAGVSTPSSAPSWSNAGSSRLNGGRGNVNARVALATYRDLASKRLEHLETSRQEYNQLQVWFHLDCL
jgi:hypothetical protein